MFSTLGFYQRCMGIFFVLLVAFHTQNIYVHDDEMAEDECKKLRIDKKKDCLAKGKVKVIKCRMSLLK